MRIIGGRDYYDGAGWGFDPTITFVRTRRDIPFHPFDDFSIDLNSERGGSYGVQFFHIVIGGRIIPAAYYKAHYYYDNYERCVWFSPEEVFERFSKCNYTTISNFSTMETARQRIIRHFSEDKSKYSEWILENRIVTGHSSAIFAGSFDNRHGTYEVHVFRTGHRDVCFIADHDGLKDLELARVVPPTVAHELILRWVGGVLPSSKPTVEISDKSKIVKAGFDLKSSFRKGKQK